MAINDFTTSNFSDLSNIADKRLEVLVKIIFTLLLIYFSLPYFTQNIPWTVFDSADLLIHEGGHLIFGFAGQFIQILGGSLMQTLMPILFAAYFAFKKSWYSLAFCVFWFGVNLISVGIYMADANTMVLPLLGGDGTIHDWHYLFNQMNVLQNAEIIGATVRSIGALFIVGGFFGMGWNIFATFRDSN